MKAKSTKAMKKPVNTKSKAAKKHSPLGKVKAKTASSKLIRTNVNMDRALHGKAKQVAAKGNTSLNKLINVAIKEYVNK